MPSRFFLLFLLILGPLFAQSLKIASWNVENLFDMQRQGTEYEEYIPDRHGWTEAMLRKKLQHTAQVICDLDADVIGLQEIENDRVLARLQKLLGRVGCPYPYRAITTGPGRPVHVALLSRVKIAKKREIPVTYSGRQRRILEVQLRTDPPLRLFVNHWRSKSGPESERILYAQALRRRLLRLPVGTEYLLLGDFNSDWQEYRIMESKLNDTHGRTGINQVLITTRNGRMVRYRDLSAHPGTFLHYTLWLELPASQRWSHNFYGNKEGIDAMLIPPSLADGRSWEYRRGSFGVYRPRYLFGEHGEIRRWEYRHGRHIGRGYSDHLPIYAKLETLAPGKSRARAPKAEAQASKCPKTDIATLQKLRSLENPRCLQGVVVIFKRGRHAVIQQRPDGPAILVYGAAAGLKEGERYDLQIEGFKRYHGMPEITDLEVLQERGGVATDAFVSPFDPSMMERPADRYRIVRDIRGRYRHRRLIVGGRELRIHFKKRRWIPDEGEKIRIKRAQIGYYKGHSELVVWDRNDFETAKE